MKIFLIFSDRLSDEIGNQGQRVNPNSEPMTKVYEPNFDEYEGWPVSKETLTKKKLMEIKLT